MSFSSDQKIEIIEAAPHAPCCKAAMIRGILAAKAELAEGKVILSVEGQTTAEFIRSLILDCFSKQAEISTSKSGGRRRLISFASPAAVKYLEEFASGGEPFRHRCAVCQSAFLRGIFLAAGRVSDPAKQYSLEFLIPYSRERVFDYLVELGLTPRISKKKNEILIYFRKSTDMEDFFALAAMNNTAFAVMNAKINGEIRNNVNRIINCTTSNIGKAVSASLQQIELIELLIERGLISKLPEELEATARLRLEHRDMSLSQLAAIITPKISKPGLSHRLKRITELARELLGIED